MSAFIDLRISWSAGIRRPDVSRIGFACRRFLSKPHSGAATTDRPASLVEQTVLALGVAVKIQFDAVDILCRKAIGHDGVGHVVRVNPVDLREAVVRAKPRGRLHK
jgi:hypothetical protein